MSTPLHSSAKRSLDDDDDELTPGSSRPRHKQAKRDSSLNRAVGQQRLILKTRMDRTPDASPAPSGSHSVMNRFIPEPSLSQAPGRRPRPLTQHQIAVEQNRRQRIEYLLAKRRSTEYRMLRAKRANEIPFVRYGRLLQSLPEVYDTEDDEDSWGKGGLLSNTAQDDFGECANFFLSVVRKASRRLDRWDYEDANGPKKDRQREREERQKAKAAFEADLRAASSRRPRPSRGGAAPKRKFAGPTSTPGTAKKSGGSARPKGGRSRPSGVDNGASWDADQAPEIEGELDDLDRELLGEGSGEEDGHAPGEGDSSDESADEDVEAEQDEVESAYGGPNGYAQRESSSPGPGQRDGGDDAMED